MTGYLMINHGGGTSQEWGDFISFLRAGGHMIGGSSVEEGISLRGGEFSKAKSETITGYIVFQAGSMEEAKEIAARCPVLFTGGMVEIFPLVEE